MPRDNLGTPQKETRRSVSISSSNPSRNTLPRPFCRALAQFIFIPRDTLFITGSPMPKTANIQERSNSRRQGPPSTLPSTSMHGNLSTPVLCHVRVRCPTAHPLFPGPGSWILTLSAYLPEETCQPHDLLYRLSHFDPSSNIVTRKRLSAASWQFWTGREVLWGD